MCLRTYQACVADLLTCEAVIARGLLLAADRLQAAVEGILGEASRKVSFKSPSRLSDSASEVANIHATNIAILRPISPMPVSIHMADELDTGDILTLDSDFKHYRWRRNRSFRLLIPLE